MDDQELERRLNWSSEGGKHAALQDVVKLLREHAAWAFAANKDDEATIVRRLAEKIELLRVQSAKVLDAFIKEAS